MPETIRCPDCGHENPAGRTSCEACNFPLTGLPEPPRPPVSSGEPVIVIPRPVRRPRPRPPASGTTLSLWLFFGTVCAVVLIWTAINGFNSSNAPVEGASEHQQGVVDSLRKVLAKDSTRADAQIALADILYDTGNWQEAVAHYRAGIARDSSRTNAIVDLGVSYYNLGNSAEAERDFRLALARDPHQSVALFNLGVVYEAREEWDTALQYFHRALESDPPEGMRPPLMEHMQSVLQKSGKKAPPLPDGR
jgi:cytochrome c-type biogenesis protein CcmH/NrfG